jgi:hypothetical protein
MKSFATRLVASIPCSQCQSHFPGRLTKQLRADLEEARVQNEMLEERNKLMEKAREASSDCSSCRDVRILTLLPRLVVTTG